MLTNQNTNEYFLFHATQESLSQGKFISTMMDYVGSVLAESISQAFELSKYNIIPVTKGDIILKDNTFYQITDEGFIPVCTMEDE